MTTWHRPQRSPSQWRHCFAVVLERKRVALGIFMVTVALSLIWCAHQTRIYRATACLQINPEAIKVLDSPNVPGGESSDDKFTSMLNTQLRILRSWSLCNQTVKALALENDKDFVQGVKRDADLASVLQACVNVQPIRGSRLIEITVENRNATLAARIADEIAQQYILNVALTRAQVESISAEADWTQTMASLDAGRKPEEIPAIANRTELSALRQQADQKEMAIAVLQRRYLAKHPKMIAAQTELKEIDAKRAQVRDDAVRQIQARYLVAKASEEKLQEILDNPAERRVLARVKDAGPMGMLAANNIRLLEPVRTPTLPVKPNVKYIVAFGILLGLFSGIGFSLLLDALDDRVKSYADVESLGLPMLSGVPRMQLPDSSRVLQTRPNSVYADAFRGLRASISLTPEAKDAKTLMVTSTAVGEGKTMVAANLSIAYALHGERTLLIDCDLHRPGVGGIFKTQSDKGFEKFLVGSMSMQEIIQPTDLPNLEVIRVGQGQSNGAELLASGRLPELLKEAAKLYDRIVIDCPPVLAGSDLLILLPHVKGVVFVIGFSKTNREDAEQAMRKLRECGAPLVGVVMNNVNGAKQKSYDSQDGNGSRGPETDNAGTVVG